MSRKSVIGFNSEQQGVIGLTVRLLNSSTVESIFVQGNHLSELDHNSYFVLLRIIVPCSIGVSMLLIFDGMAMKTHLLRFVTINRITISSNTYRFPCNYAEKMVSYKRDRNNYVVFFVTSTSNAIST